MIETVDFTDKQRSLFRQRFFLGPMTAGFALASAAVYASRLGGWTAGLSIGLLVIAAICAIGLKVTEYETNLARFDSRLPDALQIDLAKLRYLAKVLRIFPLAVVIALFWLSGVQGDLPLILGLTLMGVMAGLGAQLLFLREVTSMRRYLPSLRRELKAP